jgi:hypothetical protein
MEKAASAWCRAAPKLFQFGNIIFSPLWIVNKTKSNSAKYDSFPLIASPFRQDVEKIDFPQIFIYNVGIYTHRL